MVLKTIQFGFDRVKHKEERLFTTTLTRAAKILSLFPPSGYSEGKIYSFQDGYVFLKQTLSWNIKEQQRITQLQLPFTIECKIYCEYCFIPHGAETCVYDLPDANGQYYTLQVTCDAEEKGNGDGEDGGNGSIPPSCLIMALFGATSLSKFFPYLRLFRDIYLPNIITSYYYSISSWILKLLLYV
jgi:hypothetical protein